jgi:hypothetical protein
MTKPHIWKEDGFWWCEWLHRDQRKITRGETAHAAWNMYVWVCATMLSFVVGEDWNDD